MNSIVRKAFLLAVAFTATAAAAPSDAATDATVAVTVQRPVSEADQIYADALAKALTPAQMQAAYQQYLDTLFPMPLLGG